LIMPQRSPQEKKMISLNSRSIILFAFFTYNLCKLNTLAISGAISPVN
jgi:hypothetical protein